MFPPKGPTSPELQPSAHSENIPSWRRLGDCLSIIKQRLRLSMLHRCSFLSLTHSWWSEICGFCLYISRIKSNATRLDITTVTNFTTGNNGGSLCRFHRRASQGPPCHGLEQSIIDEWLVSAACQQRLCVGPRQQAELLQPAIAQASSLP